MQSSQASLAHMGAVQTMVQTMMNTTACSSTAERATGHSRQSYPTWVRGQSEGDGAREINQSTCTEKNQNNSYTTQNTTYQYHCQNNQKRCKYRYIPVNVKH
jgi:hypothetical protein